MARWKARGRLYIRRYWTFFAISYTAETLWAEIGRSRRFSKGWVTLSADFREKGASPTNHSWYQSSRVIALSCGIKISAVRHLVLSQSTRVTDRRTDGQNYDSQDPLAYARAVKKTDWKPLANNTNGQTDRQTNKQTYGRRRLHYDLGEADGRLFYISGSTTAIKSGRCRVTFTSPSCTTLCIPTAGLLCCA